MTGLALLTFLAHGETPASEEFGETVEKAISYLLDHQKEDGRFYPGKAPPPAVSNRGYGGGGRDYYGGPYIQAVVTYALAEAYGMTRVPRLRTAMEKGIQVVLDHQQDGGGYDYYYRKSYRADVSATGWQLQAMKAAYIAGARNEGLKEAMEKGIGFVKKVQDPESGVFSYRLLRGTEVKPLKSERLTGVAVLCLQLLGYGRDQAVKAGLASLKGTTCDWKDPPPWPMYGWYYITQAKFHAGGQTWKGWNAQFAKAYLSHQNKDGSWTSPTGKADNFEVSKGLVYSTTFAALTLMVYYHHLPTYQHTAVENEAEEFEEDDDVEVIVI